MHLTRHINDIYKETQHDNSGAIHPSSLGDCDRFAVYSYLGLEREVPHSQFLKKIFYHGHKIEDWMNDAFKNAGILIANSIPLKAELDGVAVEGELDHIIKWRGGWAIADSKSVSDHAFKYKSFPYSHHILQVGAYQWLMHQAAALSRAKSVVGIKSSGLNYHAICEEWGPENPPVLFYIGRGNLVEKTVTAGDNAMHMALEKMKKIASYINAATVPHRPFETPNDHPYKCANCTSKGSRKKQDGTRTRPSVYAPSCDYFKTCWGVLPVEWSFWSEVSL